MKAAVLLSLLAVVATAAPHNSRSHKSHRKQCTKKQGGSTAASSVSGLVVPSATDLHATSDAISSSVHAPTSVTVPNAVAPTTKAPTTDTAPTTASLPTSNQIAPPPSASSAAPSTAAPGSTGGAGSSGAQLADKFDAPTADRGAGFADGTYADGLSRYWKLINNKNGEGTYQRSPVPPEGDAMISAASTPEDIAGTSAAAKAILDAHNAMRAQYGVNPVKWNAGFAQRSVGWAANKAVNCPQITQEKSHYLGADNLSQQWSSTSGQQYPASSFVSGWSDEWKDYNYNDPQYSHFSELVWKSVTEIGCAWNFCDEATSSIIFRCQYGPPGNFIGQFAENVPKWINQNGLQA